jgi:Xaa-Pro dipeptidase
VPALNKPAALLAPEGKADALLAVIAAQGLPEKYRLCQGLLRIFGGLKRYFDNRQDLTGAELDAYAPRCAGFPRWLFGAAIAGHIVGEFPYVRIPGNKDFYRISLANKQRMRDPDVSEHMKDWIIEAHLVNRARTLGGFYGQLL